MTAGSSVADAPHDDGGRRYPKAPPLPVPRKPCHAQRPHTERINMTSTATSPTTPLSAPTRSPRQQFLDAYEREHAITMKVLRAYPADKAELRPHPRLKTARELAWVFVLERGLGKAGLANAFASGQVGGKPPEAPDSWSTVVEAVEQAHADFRDHFSSYTDDQLQETIKFFAGPNTLVDVPRIDFA